MSALKFLSGCMCGGHARRCSWTVLTKQAICCGFRLVCIHAENITDVQASNRLLLGFD